jgi:hypothetical protein
VSNLEQIVAKGAIRLNGTRIMLKRCGMWAHVGATARIGDLLCSVADTSESGTF